MMYTMPAVQLGVSGRLCCSSGRLTDWDTKFTINASQVKSFLLKRVCCLSSLNEQLNAQCHVETVCIKTIRVMLDQS